MSDMSAMSELPSPVPDAGRHPYRVIMVCTGNICRSAMAEVVARDRLQDVGAPDLGAGGVAVTSAGVSSEEQGNPMDPRARRVLAEAGYTGEAANVIAAHRAHRMTDAEILGADLLLAMTDAHHRVLARRAGALGADPSRILMYRELDPAAGELRAAVRAGTASRRALDVPDPWYGTMADFVETLEVVERVSDVLAERLRERAGA